MGPPLLDPVRFGGADRGRRACRVAPSFGPVGSHQDLAQHAGAVHRSDRARDDIEPLVSHHKGVLEGAQIGQVGAARRLDPAHRAGQITGPGHHIGAHEGEFGVPGGDQGRKFAEQLPAAGADIEDLRAASRESQRGDGAGEEAPRRPVRRGGEVSGRPAGIAIEPGGPIERRVPGIDPGVHES